MTDNILRLLETTAKLWGFSRNLALDVAVDKGGCVDFQNVESDVKSA